MCCNSQRETWQKYLTRIASWTPSPFNGAKNGQESWKNIPGTTKKPNHALSKKILWKAKFCWIRQEKSLEGVCHYHPEGGCTKCVLLFLGVWSCRNQCMLRDKWFKIIYFLFHLQFIPRPCLKWKEYPVYPPLFESSLYEMYTVYFFSGPHHCHVLGHPKSGFENNPVEIPPTENRTPKNPGVFCRTRLALHTLSMNQLHKPFKMTNY